MGSGLSPSLFRLTAEDSSIGDLKTGPGYIDKHFSNLRVLPTTWDLVKKQALTEQVRGGA